MREMKQSGIQWIGKIPETWEVLHVKRLFEIGRGRVIAATEVEDDGFPVYSSQTLNNGCMGYLKTYDFDCSQLTWTTDGANAGTVFLREGKHNCTNVCGTLKPLNSNSNLRFICYALHHVAHYNKRYDINGYKIMNNEMAMIQLALPPQPEQSVIADFLDYKCEKIDTIIALEETIISELNEYKKSIIQKAIDDNSINWETQRFTIFFSLGKGLPITKADLQDEGIPVVSYGEIHSKYGRELNPDIHPLKCVKDTYLESDKASLLQYGDFVFADTSEDLEGSGNFTFLNSHTPVFAGYHTIIARPKTEIDFLFLSFLCDSYKFREQIQSQVVGIKVFSITKGLLKNVNLWLPPLPEQKAIAAYLDKKTGEVDKLISIKQKKITELKEYKKSLIYEYVTGKKEVPA
jgi:type I restriction enzyme, S subunit